MEEPETVAVLRGARPVLVGQPTECLRLEEPPRESPGSEDELLNGPLLHVTSVGFLGMLVQLEDELGVTLPDDLFAGRTFNTVGDLIDVVATAS